jgi:predicted nucleic acid-binding protein
MYTIDTSVFINAVEPLETDHSASRQLLGTLRVRRLAIVVPTLVTVEVAGTMSRLRDANRAHRLVVLLRRLPTVTFIPLDDALAQHAATLAAAHLLRGADAVYAAVAQQFGTTLISRDREHLTRLPAVVPVLHPTDALTRLQTTT